MPICKITCCSLWLEWKPADPWSCVAHFCLYDENAHTNRCIFCRKWQFCLRLLATSLEILRSVFSFSFHLVPTSHSIEMTDMADWDVIKIPNISLLEQHWTTLSYSLTHEVYLCKNSTANQMTARVVKLSVLLRRPVMCSLIYRVTLETLQIYL